jgi:hypothetical protein
MDFPSRFIISFLIHSSINIGHPSCFSITFKTCASFIAFPVSSESLCYVNTVCSQLLRKFATLFLLCILHFFKSLFKRFPWSPLQISFWNEFVFHTVNLLSSELNSYYLLLCQVFRCCFYCAEVFRCAEFLRQSFPLLFLLPNVFEVFRCFYYVFPLCQSFPLLFLLPKFSITSKFFHCCFYCAEFSAATEFSAADLFAAQSFLLLPFPVHSCKSYYSHSLRREAITIYCRAHLKLTYINIMTTLQSKRKNARSGKVMRFEPHDLKLVNADPMIRVSFEQAGCIRFCEKIQGYNAQLTKHFTLNFTGVSTTIAGITFQVSEETISAATEIPMQGEKWFKGMPLDTSCYIDFIKPEYRNRKIGASIPSEYLLEPFEKLLKIIQKYFTCEGRFDKVHQYHIRLLMHFTGRSPLNLPFFLCRSLGKMADNVQAKADQP